jgi:N-acetylneuraminic acid mutarotase
MPAYRLGGTVAGLSGPGLVLANGSATLAVVANATTFTFPGSLQSGASYAVTIRTQPAGQTCTLTNAAGTVDTGDVTNIAIACPSPWVWIGGPNSPNGAAVYGTQGVAAPANLPGARSAGVTWTDASGTFWLFGGVDAFAGDNYYNDLWQYSAATGQWTWVAGANTPNALGVYGTQGVSAPANIPGARAGAVSWTDPGGNFWLFGGTGFDSTGGAPELNDLWKYSPNTGLWTWVSGSNISGADGVYGTRGVAAAANVPPARNGATAWIDGSGNLWIFGGAGLAQAAGENDGLFNDLWEYSPTSGLWTWVSGAMGPIGSNDNGVYGTRGMAAPSNMPGARRRGASWTDASGDLWLFGGQALATPEEAFFSDLWKFDPHSGLWTWEGGPDAQDDPGEYGNEGTGSGANNPPARSDTATVIDASGKVWLFGGYGVAAGYGALDLAPGQFNDLWRFDPATSQWTWMSGSIGPSGAGTYGTQGLAAPGNVPTARAAAFLWIDSERNIFLFAGAGDFASAGGGGESEWNDLWKFAGGNFP